jgi:hypothetical protein
MRKINFIITIVLTCFYYSGSYSQNVIAVEHSGVSTFYQNLDSALAHSVNGDNVYLPGATYNVGNLTINKGVHIIGAGCNFDSTLATGATIFLGDPRILKGADNGSIEGIYIQGEIRFGTEAANQEVHNYSISRCNMTNLWLSFDNGTASASDNIYISENVFRGNIYGGNVQNVVVSKCIIENVVSTFNGNAVFTNNIFLKNPCGENLIVNAAAITFQNNIFLIRFCSYWGSYYLTGANAGINFNHNLFIEGDPVPTGNISNGSIINSDIDKLFVTQSGNLYNIKHNYHLKPDCLGKNAGTDGTDVGIYGTATPAKDGQIPFNPHIQSKSISSSTNPEGNLNINIKVKAQDN